MAAKKKKKAASKKAPRKASVTKAPRKKAAPAKGGGTFELVTGTHSEDGEVYSFDGDNVIDSPHDLCRAFPNKFRRLQRDPRLSDVEEEDEEDESED